nr:MAG TPA: hypothetical protein [Caudoviricetes sp.]
MNLLQSFYYNSVYIFYTSYISLLHCFQQS